MKFLVIGASGYIGWNCYEYIQSLGYEVIGTQLKSRLPHLVTFDLSLDSIGDVIGHSFFSRESQVYGVIFAGVSEVDRCFKEKKESYKINVENTIKLIKDLLYFGVKPIYFSSSAVYDGLLGYYNEGSLCNPICEYGRHKVKVEEFIQKHATHSLIFRLDKVLGDTVSERNLFSEWYNLIEKGETILCIEDQIFSPTYISDVSKSIVIACQKNLEGTYNLANTEFFARKELARQFALSLGKKCRIEVKSQEELEFSEFRPPRTFLDSTKFIEATGFNFTPMREVFDRFKKNIKNLGKDFYISPNT